MGLCKCPKRTVTNQFCYEHRVNVCEHCMVSNHPKCIVLSYLKWLQDGDYNPICELCSQNLIDDDCVRLVCYHVFHWPCLNSYAQGLPSVMAPAGYVCPSCKSPLFPSPNLVSPVADALKKKLETANWAKLSSSVPSMLDKESTSHDVSSDYKFRDNFDSDHFNELMPRQTVVHIEEQFNNANVFDNIYTKNVPRRLAHVADKGFSFPRDDCDDNKYKRKNETEKFANSFHLCVKRSRYFHFFRKHKYRRYLAICVFLFIIFFLLMFALEKIGNQSAAVEEPIIDPILNIRVNNADS